MLEEYTLTDILNDVTKDDLRCLRLRYLLFHIRVSRHKMTERNIKLRYPEADGVKVIIL